MADPKYANLPGIAHDQPDLYETNDLPEADQNRDEVEEDSEFIEKVKINASESFQKFSDKNLLSDNVDFSDPLGKSKKIGYDARSHDWELAALGEKETLSQRFERLKLETRELMNDINTLKDKDSSADKSKEVASHNLLSGVEAMLAQLDSLAVDDTLSAGSGSLASSSLINIIDQNQHRLREAVSAVDTVCEDGSTGEGGVDSGLVKYTVMSQPSAAIAHLSKQIASMETNVAALSNALFASPCPPVSFRNATGNSLVDMARDVERKASIIQVTQLEAAESRASDILTKMDLIKQRMAELNQVDATNAPVHDKVNELYDLSRNVGEISEMLPSVMERMVVLENMHKQAVDFGKSKVELETLLDTLKSMCETNKKLATKLDDNFNKNFETIKKCVDSLDGRVENLSRKKSKK